MRDLKNSLIIMLVIASFASNTLAETFKIEIFDKAMLLPSEYIVDTQYYSKNTKVRFYKDMGAQGVSEITVYDIDICEGNCEKIITSIDFVSLKRKHQHPDFTIFELEGDESFPLAYLVFFEYGDRFVKLSNDKALAKEWIKVLTLKG